jgi:succinate dehydrogenase / fumarate reductase cytochrome b subunit
MSEAVKEVPKKVRPEFRNIHVTELGNYRQPPSAIVSILHRISGAGLFLMLPFLLYLLQLSLRSEGSFMQFKGVLEHPFIKIVCWSFAGATCIIFAPVSATCSWTTTSPSTKTVRASPPRPCSS